MNPTPTMVTQSDVLKRAGFTWSTWNRLREEAREKCFDDKDYVVKAVNHHEALVSALRGLIYNLGVSENLDGFLSDAVDYAVKALIALEGEGGKNV